MKTKFRLTMVLGIITAAIVTAEVPLGKPMQEASNVTGCYSEQEVSLLMDIGHYNREEAIVMLEFACEHAITVK